MSKNSLKTVEKLFKLYTLWTAFIHQNVTFLKTTYSVLYSETENNVLQSWNVSESQGLQCALSHRDFCWFNKQVQNLKIVYKNVPCLCHSCYTKTPWVMFSVVVWWIYTLWFTYDLLKIFNEKHQTEIKDFKATLLWFFKPFAEIFQIIMLRQGLII